MVIAVVGAGGKTTHIKKLAEKYRSMGMRVLITTTTHMYREKETVISNHISEILEKIQKEGICMAGTLSGTEKISALPENIYQELCKKCDVVLVEADGAAGKSIKYPSDKEPVIPENVDEIHVILGLKALGQTFFAAAHRLEYVKRCLHVTDVDTVQFKHLQKLWKEGYEMPLKEKYPGSEISFHPGQADSLYERVMAAFLREDTAADAISEEWFAQKPELFLCGGGHVSQKVAQLGRFLDFRVTVYEERKEFASKKRIPWADTILCDSYENLARYLGGGRQRYYLVATSGHDKDLLCVEQILQTDYEYVGMLGSKGKVAHVRAALEENGFAAERIDTLHAPVGIKIGGQTPEEIAVSIAAELVQVRSARSAGMLPSALEQVEEDGILCIITGKSGSSPRGIGSMMFVPFKETSKVRGTIGGGTVEHLALLEAGEMRTKPAPGIRVREYGLEKGGALGMVCGGRVEITFVPLITEA